MPFSVTMASPAPSGAGSDVAKVQATDCPVLKAWSESQWVLQRLMSKGMLVVADKSLNREAVTLNRELLIPLINLVGPWTEISMFLHDSRHGCLSKSYIIPLQPPVSNPRFATQCRPGRDVLAETLCRMCSRWQGYPFRSHGSRYAC